MTIVVKVGTTADQFAAKAYPKATLRKLDSESDCANSVALGKVDAFIYDKPYLELFASKNAQRVFLLKENLTVEDFGVAARKSDTALIGAFNEFLKGWKKWRLRSQPPHSFCRDALGIIHALVQITTATQELCRSQLPSFARLCVHKHKLLKTCDSWV